MRHRYEPCEPGCDCVDCLVFREEIAGRERVVRPRKPMPGTKKAIEQRYGRHRVGPRRKAS